MLRTPATPTPEWLAQGRWLRRLNELEQVIVARERGEDIGVRDSTLKWEIARDIAKLEVAAATEGE